MIPDHLAHPRTFRGFLWLAVISWGIALGAKIFDLLVLGTAWGASPPASFDLLPYGKSFPVDPGNFFQPLSGFLLLCSVGALITGWKGSVRRWLAVAVGSFVLIWIFTPTVFWPMINELWEIHRGRITRTDLEMAALVRKWFEWDSFRIVLIATGFVSCLRAFGVPISGKAESVGRSAANDPGARL